MTVLSRVLTLLLALALALPLTAFAGGGKAASDTSSPSATIDKDTTGGGTKSQSDADVKGKDNSGQASPATTPPASKDACKDSGWQKHGFKTEAECVAAAPATDAGTKK